MYGVNLKWLAEYIDGLTVRALGSDIQIIGYLMLGPGVDLLDELVEVLIGETSTEIRELISRFVYMHSPYTISSQQV